MKTLVGIKDLENGEDLTLEEAKKFDCCKDLSDEEINELLEVLKVFTEIAFSVFAKKKAEQEKKKQDQENDDYKLAA